MMEKYADLVDLRWRNRLLEELTFLALDRLRESGISHFGAKKCAALSVPETS